MRTTRDDAMAALRTWSAPGRRAELLEAAWNAGETTISALAEAARISRPTVYADLRCRGIDPDQRHHQEDKLTTIAIEGMNGTEADKQAVGEGLRRYIAQHPDGRGLVEEEGRLFCLHLALYAYNRIIEATAKEEATRRDRDRALHQVEIRWEALSTAANWHAAHHTYVVAVDAARTAIDAWESAAAALMDAPAMRRGVGNDRVIEVYEQYIVGAGHPPVSTPDIIDAADEAAQLRDRLEATHARRTALAAQTLGLTEAGAR
ncbi:hypothetical protein [Streptomyces kronopolitis]|uniref:hypothetical protein n=1 Tax=Streptomyces kronopolitis TaxID=1612435 RepID=UPI003D977469